MNPLIPEVITQSTIPSWGVTWEEACSICGIDPKKGGRSYQGNLFPNHQEYFSEEEITRLELCNRFVNLNPKDQRTYTIRNFVRLEVEPEKIFQHFAKCDRLLDRAFMTDRVHELFVKAYRLNPELIQLFLGEKL